MTLAMGVEKITIGSNIPAYEVGEKIAPAVIVLQVRGSYDMLAYHARSSSHDLSSGAGMVGRDR